MGEESYDNVCGDYEGPWTGREGRGHGWEGPWGGRGRGFFRGGKGRKGCPFFDPRREFMEFYSPDHDFLYQKPEPEHGGPHPFHRYGRGHHAWFPRHHGLETHPVPRPGHQQLGRRANHAFTVDVYPFEAKNTEIKIEDKKLLITSTNKGGTRQTVQTFRLPEHSNAETWNVDQETTDTTVILMTRSKAKNTEATKKSNDE